MPWTEIHSAFIKETTWRRINKEFCAEEKFALINAVTSTILKPPGFTLDLKQLTDELRSKLTYLIDNIQKTEGEQLTFKEFKKASKYLDHLG